MNKICPLLIVGSTRDKIIFRYGSTDSFDADRYQCLGSMCAAYGVDQDGLETCGMVLRRVEETDTKQ